jgi:hypothetical protein
LSEEVSPHLSGLARDGEFVEAIQPDLLICPTGVLADFVSSPF